MARRRQREEQGGREGGKTHLAADVFLFEFLLEIAREDGVLIEVLLLAQRAHTFVEQQSNTPQSLGQVAEPPLRLGRSTPHPQNPGANLFSTLHLAVAMHQAAA